MTNTLLDANDKLILQCEITDDHFSNNGKINNDEKCYSEEWDQLLEANCIGKLRTMGLKGQLRQSHFRSICWRIFLECLPEKHSEWIKSTNILRQKYQDIQNKLYNNPRSEKDSLDLVINNPLSQEDKSPWNQYFQDSELKITIQQDVIRTFPEIDFFHTSKVQQMMVNILFCFAREYPHISYRQGMHELLAPIIYVLHSDQEAFFSASKTASIKLMEEIKVLLDPSYTEHDAFFIFCQVMDVVESWYLINEYSSNKYTDQFVLAPFSRPRETGPTSILGVKLTKINEQILRRHDLELFSHLETLEITPQIYGIRWLRLLFGREFPMQDLLQIWDSIFADSLSFDLVDYVFTTMLMSIRELLLTGDYTTCLKHLMKYPSISDVNYVIELALHLRDPVKYSRPVGNSLKVTTALSGNRNSLHNTLPKSYSSKNSNKHGGSSFSSIIRRSGGRPKTLALPIGTEKAIQGKSSSEPATLESTSPSSDSEVSGVSTVDKNREKYQKHFRQTSDSIMHSSRHSGSNTSYTLPRKYKIGKEQPNLSQSLTHLDKDKNYNSENSTKEMVTLSTQHSNHYGMYRQSSKERDEMKQLKMELSELKSMSQYCCHRMTQHLDRLQFCMIHQELQHEDEMLLALAGLKRVRDILKGTVNFTEEVGDDEYLHDTNPDKLKSSQIGMVKKSDVEGSTLPQVNKEGNKQNGEKKCDDQDRSVNGEDRRNEKEDLIATTRREFQKLLNSSKSYINDNTNRK
ncbi:TBC1 domain family member 5-like [Centruroides sculpturatus]|uniref:TBC1 domain family member 5-like n=2 Tax=Centruroides sculpturatus TaxID=218467 RepID=UPI000C6DC44C|nr:TBC1 domain family member 5-like [Centruroides sculpturatus]